MSKDPIVQELAQLIHASKLNDTAIAERVGEMRKAKMAPSTVAKLRHKETRRPTNYTIDWISAALGWRRQWARIGE